MAAEGRDRGGGGGGGRGRPGALPALGAAHTKGCRENTEGRGLRSGIAGHSMPAQLCVCHPLPAHGQGGSCAQNRIPVPAGPSQFRGNRDGSVRLSPAQPSSRHSRAQPAIRCRRYRDLPGQSRAAAGGNTR